MLAVCLMFGGATLVAAQDQSGQATQSQSQTMDQDQDRQQISVSELPEAVTAKLESQDYAAWTVGNVYKKTDESQNEIYIVELKQGTDTKKVKFDRDGNQIDKNKMKSDKTGSSDYRSPEHDGASSQDATSQDATDQADNTESQSDVR